MSFDDVWNTAYEATPADNENISLGAGRIRDLKINIRERAGIDHSWGDAQDDGKHNQVTLHALSVTPTTPTSTDGCVFSKQVAGNTELFFRDSAGRLVQITNIGAVAAPSPFPSGTVMLFAQSAPPSGWTQVTSNTDRMLRLVNDSSGGAVGGSWTISGTSLSLATSVTTTTTTTDNGSTATPTINSHVLSASEIPAHTHDTVLAFGGGSAAITGGAGANVPTEVGSTVTSGTGTGGGGGHTHTGSTALSLTLASVSSSAATPTGSFSNNGNWRPLYLNVLAASKN